MVFGVVRDFIRAVLSSNIRQDISTNCIFADNLGSVT